MKRLRLVAAAAALGLVAGLPFTVASAASLGLSSQALTTYRTCTLTALPGRSATGRDATVRQGSPSGNFGAGTPSHVASGNGTNRRLYVAFDLAACRPTVPAGAVIRLAALRLFLTSVPACRTVDIFPVPATWTETLITWANQPVGTAINVPPSAERSGVFTVGTPVGCQNQAGSSYIVGATVTGDVAAAVAGGSTALSWMLRDDVEGSAPTRTIAFAARESGVPARAPQLVVSYVRAP